MIKGNGKARRLAKARRRQMTLPEGLLWRQLRRNGTGHHWRHEHPAGPYSLDFYCDAAKLCVEVDGEAHERGNRPSFDARRDGWLAANGIVTLRIPAVDVLRNLEGVVRLVSETARERAPLHRPSDGPPPRDKLGEE